MFIQTETTPNPNTIKFLPGENILKGEQGLDFLSPQQAENNPLAKQLFTAPGIKSIFFGKDFISITKNEIVEWPQIKPDILGMIVDFFTSKAHLNISEAPLSEEQHKSDNEQAAAKIREILETRVRPAVAQDGGDIVLERFEKGIAYLKMRGACSGCPSSAITLKNGVENLLRYYVPELIQVVASEISEARDS